MNDTCLKYGATSISLNVPESAVHLGFKEPAYDIDQVDFVHRLRELLAGRDIGGSIAIVVADKTRLCGYGQILPWVVKVFEELGVGKDRIQFFIAYGTHPRQSDEECLAAYGEVYQQYTFVHHDCHDRESFKEVGKTGRGTPVLVRRELCEASLILTIGAVSHHYFAGYGGGRKLLFPGLGEREAIYTNHRLFLDPAHSCLSRGCQPGNLEENPLADDLEEIHAMLPPYISIHGILDSKGQAAKFYFGSTYEDFLAVCRELDNCYRVEVGQQFDLVVASSGGYPKDINFIQTHKSVHNAARLVRDGGVLVILAECRDDIGSATFLPYFEMGGWQQTFQHLSVNYAGNGGTALAMMEKTGRIEIRMVTELSAELCSRIGVEKISADQVNELLSQHKGTVAIVENSSLLVANLKGQ